jgi:hypothetical protein
VDSNYSGDEGTFVLIVEEIATPTNTTCSTAQTVTLSGGKGSVTGDLSSVFAPDEFSTLQCNSSNLDGPNLYYKFTPTAGKSYKITFKPKGRGGRYGAWDGNHGCVAASVANECGKLGYTYVSGNSMHSKTITASAGDIYFVADGLNSSYNVYDFSFDIEQL